MGGLNNPVSEKTALISYKPTTAKNTGDLETATKTITATAEASGTGNADYSAALTMVIPTDSRLSILRYASRLAVTVDSMTATHLYCKVYVDIQDADHLLFSEDITATGPKLDAVDTLVGAKGIIYNLLKDGTAHTFYFFFWVDADNAVLSVVQLWAGPGSCTTGGAAPVATINYTGMVSFIVIGAVLGTGALTMQKDTVASSNYAVCAITSGLVYTELVNSIIHIYARSTVATDISSILGIYATLKGAS
jgi:hypothetical protein